MNHNQKGIAPIAIAIIVVAVVIIGGMVGYYVLKQKPTTPTNTTTVSCESKKEEIKNMLSGANFCNKDEDCKIVNIPLEYYEFGCNEIYVNINADLNKISNELSDYKEKCNPILPSQYACSPNPAELCCKNNKCGRWCGGI